MGIATRAAVLNNSLATHYDRADYSFLDPSDGAFGRFDLAALCGCRTLNFCLFVTLHGLNRQTSDNLRAPGLPASCAGSCCSASDLVSAQSIRFTPQNAAVFKPAQNCCW